MTLTIFARAAGFALIVTVFAGHAAEPTQSAIKEPAPAVNTTSPSWPIPGRQAWSSNEGEFVTLKAPYLDLHTAPGRGYPIFHVVEKNEKLRIFKRRGDWYELETEDGKHGWAQRKTLSQLQDSAGRYLAVSNPTWRDAGNNPWQFSLLAGSTQGAITYTSLLAYRFTPNISAEVKYTQAFGNASTIKLTSVNLVHQPFPLWRVSPFITLGSGAVATKPNAVIVKPEHRQDNFISAGGGLFIHASARIDIRAEYIKDTVLTHRETNEEIEEWKAGFSLLF